jgi:hypothetical protein
MKYAIEYQYGRRGILYYHGSERLAHRTNELFTPELESAQTYTRRADARRRLRTLLTSRRESKRLRIIPVP